MLSVSGRDLPDPRICLVRDGERQLLRNDWDDGQREAYGILNSSYTQFSILTYDHLLARAKNVLGVMELGNEEEIPFSAEEAAGSLYYAWYKILKVC